MDLDLRPAVPGDFAALRAIAAAAGSPDGDDRYFAFVRSIGRLVVATQDDTLVGFAGVVPVLGAAMVSDLFVDHACRGHGVGRRLLHAVLEDHSPRLTFSSTHPAALHLYSACGMVPAERLLTMAGVGVGDGPPLVPGEWRHDRHELVSYFGRSGAVVTDHSVVHCGDGAVDVWRVDGDESQRALADIIDASMATDTITLSMLEAHPLVPWLEQRGFCVIDHDVRCSSPGVDPIAVATCVHRGLC